MKILIACGGTAGHIFPGLALAEEIKKETHGCQIIIVVSASLRDKECLQTAGFLWCRKVYRGHHCENRTKLSPQAIFLKDVKIETVASSPLPYRISFKYIPFTLVFLLALLKSFKIILRDRPQVVVGFGGSAAFAPLIVARIIGLPTLIHEQNLIPGRANLLLARIVDRIAVTFDATNKFFPWHKSNHKIVKTGLPLRRQILNSASSVDDRFSSTRDKFTLLVLGGSQGAQSINELVLDCLSIMDRVHLAHLQLIHLTGKRDFSHIKARYVTLGVTSWVFDFLEDMASAYRRTDLVISRSGASTIFEVASFGLPCILVPHSFGTRHQQENALFLQRLGAAVVFDEQSSSAQDLKEILIKLIENKALRENLSQRISRLEMRQATHNLKEQVLALHRGHYVCE